MLPEIGKPTPAGGNFDKPSQSIHVPALDGVRGLAILLVLGVHLFASNSEGGGRVVRILADIIGSGSIGVNLFFVLSGFLITGILLDTLADPDYFKVFYARRALRIFPLYYGFLIFLLLVTRPMHLSWGGRGPFLFTYTANLAFWHANQFIPIQPFNINHFWSLQVEEQFYFVWPLVVYWLRAPLRIVKAALIGCGCVLVLRIFFVFFCTGLHNIYLPYSFTPSCMDNLLYGCCLAALMRSTAKDHVLRWAPAVFTSGSILTLGMGAYYGGLPWQTNNLIPTTGFTLIAITWTALIALILRGETRTRRMFAHPVLRFFGRYSYGLYVFHYSIAEIVGLPIRVWMNTYFHSKALAVCGGAIASLTLSIALAMLSFHLYEVKFLRLKRCFPYRMQQAAG